MRIVIIEDEELMAEDLENCILQADPQAHIVAKLASVAEALAFLEENNGFDLVFSDIQLGDGLSFDVFKRMQLKVPVIFCTAFDEYALEAFKANGVDYILKPFSQDDIDASLNKYKLFTHRTALQELKIDEIIRLIRKKSGSEISSILVYVGDKIIPVKSQEIALAFIKDDHMFIMTFEQKRYLISQNLDDLEISLGNEFYRANRQILIRKDNVREAVQYLARKLLIKPKIDFEEQILVSKAKASEFLDWLRA